MTTRPMTAEECDVIEAAVKWAAIRQIVQHYEASSQQLRHAAIDLARAVHSLHHASAGCWQAPIEPHPSFLHRCPRCGASNPGRDPLAEGCRDPDCPETDASLNAGGGV